MIRKLNSEILMGASASVKVGKAKRALVSPFRMGLLKVTIPVFAASLVFGCSVKQSSVPSAPPDLRQGLQPFSAETGKLRPQPGSFSIFFWPEGVSGMALAQLVGKVNVLSKQVDDLSSKMKPIATSRGQKEGLIKATETEVAKSVEEFKAQNCVQKFAVLPVGIDPLTVEEISEWKPIDPSDQSAATGLANCQKNQQARKEKKAIIEEAQVEISRLTAEFDPLQQKQTAIIDAIKGLINLNGVDNFLSVNASGSRLEIKGIDTGFAVDVQLRDFGFKTNHQFTEPGKTKLEGAQIYDAKFDPEMRMVTFKVPEVKINAEQKPELTGAVMEFELSRNKDFVGWVRFTGDVRLVRNGQILRNGSVKIDGDFIK